MSDRYKFMGSILGRWSGKTPSETTLPKSSSKILEAPYDLVLCVFPGYDAIGADIYNLSTMSLSNGDDVIYAGIHPARVIASLPNGEVRIKFNDTNLIPPRMNVPVHELEIVLGDGSRKKFVNKDFKCPDCNVPWKETEGFRFSFFDCPKCGMKKEDCFKEIA